MQQAGDEAIVKTRLYAWHGICCHGLAARRPDRAGQRQDLHGHHRPAERLPGIRRDPDVRAREDLPVSARGSFRAIARAALAGDPRMSAFTRLSAWAGGINAGGHRDLVTEVPGKADLWMASSKTRKKSGRDEKCSSQMY